MSKALSASLGVPSSAGTYSAALEGLTGVNEVLMRRDPSIPPLYSTGAKWELRPGDPSETQWRYAPNVATEGWGDCQDLSAYRAAELRVTGEDPNAHVRVYPTGPNRYHAVVARGNGVVEDPSAILGMNPVPEAPMSTMELPAVAGLPGDPISPLGTAIALPMIRSGVRALHPNATPDVAGIPCLGPECGPSEKLARIRDVAPEVTGPTFHVSPHRVGSVCGFKGIHRVPLKDGTAIVGMTRTYANPTDCIGDGPGIMTRIGNAILNHPILSSLVSPEAYLATRALMDPGTQHALNATADAAKSTSVDDGWGDLSVVGAARAKLTPISSGSPTRQGGSPSANRVALTPAPPGAIDPTSGQPFPPGTMVNPNTGLPPGMHVTPAQAAQASQMAKSGSTGTPIPPGTIDPSTGMPFPVGTTVNPATGQPTYPPGYTPPYSPYGAAPYSPYGTTPGSYPGMYSPYGAINPMTGQPFPPGTTPLGMQSAFTAAQTQYGGGGGGGYASDFGIPSGSTDPGTSYGGGFSSDYGGGLPDYDSSALATYTDPSSQLGYWNT